ncbi:MAG: NifB/NifX family molybdenum-iron cluster-binding protein [Clostridia bacterium]|nr:NifB/NifX family molybdenum-iron cluster-binding protein [Clostridia bacterium]
MKIVIPVDENLIGTGVCPSFGRTPYFMMYDTESKESIFIENAAARSAGGAGIKAAQTIVDNRVSVVIAPRCGENAANVLVAAGVKLYKSTNESAMDNIQSFISDKLLPLDNIHPGFHNHGNN